MSFREFLKNMGLEKVDAIMAEYGEQTTKNLTTIDELRNQVTTLTSEKETFETNQKEAIKEMLKKQR